MIDKPHIFSMHRYRWRRDKSCGWVKPMKDTKRNGMPLAVSRYTVENLVVQVVQVVHHRVAGQSTTIVIAKFRRWRN